MVTRTYGELYWQFERSSQIFQYNICPQKTSLACIKKSEMKSNLWIIPPFQNRVWMRLCTQCKTEAGHWFNEIFC